MKHASKSTFSFLLMTVGLFFLLNPMLALFDILPDFIGCALIMLALHRLCAIARDFEDAFGYFKYMLIASVARLFVALASAQFDDVTMLSVSLVLGITEAIIAFLAFTALSDGLSSIRVKFGGIEKDPVEIKNIGTVFFAVRGLCSLLPYISSVLDRDDDLLLPGHVEAKGEYAALLMLVNVIITLILAGFFASAIINHVARLAKKSEVSLAISAELEDRKARSPEFFVRKNLIFAITLLAYCPIFLVDFISGLPVGGRNFIPDFIFGIIAFWAVFLLRKQLPCFKAPLISASIYTVISVLSYVFYDKFLQKAYYADFDVVISQFLKPYITAVAFAVAETAALIVLAAMLVRYLMPLATHFSIPEIPSEFTRLRAQMEKQRTLSCRLLKGFGIFLSIIALAGTAITVTFQMFDVGYDDLDFPYLLAHIILHIVFYIYCSTMFLRFKNGVLKRYETPEDVK